MDVLNKLRSTVSSTVSTLSGVLPGNPVTREFEANQHICSAGPGLLWKVYTGYKKSTKQEASIFVFEKKLLERWPRESRQTILDSLKRGVAQLTRLRHPQVLIVQHPLEESRDNLAFATEPVFASLSNILGNYENMPSPSDTVLKSFKLYDIETKYGLLQIGEGLSFLHNDVKLLHCNISPESIVVNQQGAWKIFGFDFCIHSDTKAENKGETWSGSEYSSYSPQVAQPNLDYLAPEAGLANVWSPACDMFSLGSLIYALQNDGIPPIEFHEEYNSYKRKINELKNIQTSKFNKIPDGLKEITKMLLNFTAELRPDAHQFRKVEYFEDVGVKTLNYLDSLFQWDKLQKSQFYKGLSPIIQQFPHRVCLNRVIPCLGKEFANPTMVPFVLPVVLQVAEKSTKPEYMTHIFPHLQTAMKLTEPVQVLLIFMQKMELLLKLTPPEEVKCDVLPMLYRALDSNAQQIQELCLSVLPTYATLIDYPAMKNSLLPRIKKLCISTNLLSVRVNCLVCVGKLLEHLDKWLVLDEILPFLQQIPSREPAVLMAILGIFKITVTHKKLGIPKEVIATKIIPFVMPMTIENGLTLNQFNTLFSVIRDLVNRVENEHRPKVEQLNAMSQEANALKAEHSSISSDINKSTKSDLDSIFSGGQSNNNLENKAGLSMDDKQRILRQKESAERFGTQGTPITPMQIPPKFTAVPKDLTSTLLDSNLASLTVSNKNISLPNFMDASQNIGNSNIRSTGQGVNSQFNKPQMLPTQSIQQPSFNWITNVGTQNIPMNYSSFPSSLNAQQPQINMMASGFSNVNHMDRSFGLTNAKTGNNSSGNPLSSSDINDFLS